LYIRKCIRWVYPDKLCLYGYCITVDGSIPINYVYMATLDGLDGFIPINYVYMATVLDGFIPINYVYMATVLDGFIPMNLFVSTLKPRTNRVTGDRCCHMNPPIV